MNDRVSRTVAREGRAWLAALRCSLSATLALLLALLVVAQLPRYYAIDVGIGEGYGGDLPMLNGVHTPEQSEHGSYRWTQDEATVRLPGIGQRSLLLRLDFLPVSDEALEHGPTEIALWHQETRLATLPVRQPGAHTTLLIPAQVLSGGKAVLTLRSETFSPPGPDDPRSLGTPLDRIIIKTLPLAGIVSPDWRAIGQWVLAVFVASALLAYLLPGPWREEWPFVGRWAMALVGTLALLVVLTAWLDPPRWAFGGPVVLETVGACVVLALVLRLVLPRFAARAGVVLDRRFLGGLIVLVVLAFGLRFGGRLYPRSMPGDINFHTHRFVAAVRLGDLFLEARNRGVDFPYPPGGYLTLAPFALLQPDIPRLLETGAALTESLSAVLISVLVVRGLATGEKTRRSLQPVALGAAGIYVFTAAGFMTSWWSFDTHIYTQSASLLLITACLFVVTSPSRFRMPDRPLWGGATVVGVLAAGVFLGHFGFFINMTLMGGLLLVLLWLATGRSGPAWVRKWRVPLTLAFAVPLAFSLLCFYSGYLPLFLEHARAAAEGGLPEVAQRAPVSRRVLWQGVWEIGFIHHFGFFPLMLMPVGMGVLWQATKNAPSGEHRRGQLVLLALMGCSVAVSLLFGVLPFLTLSSQSTRWLMFSAWTVAVGSALAARVIWRCGNIGRVVVVAMAGFVLWNTAVFWLGPLAWRIRPPEPF